MLPPAGKRACFCIDRFPVSIVLEVTIPLDVPLINQRTK